MAIGAAAQQHVAQGKHLRQRVAQGRDVSSLLAVSAKRVTKTQQARAMEPVQSQMKKISIASAEMSMARAPQLDKMRGGRRTDEVGTAMPALFSRRARLRGFGVHCAPCLVARLLRARKRPRHCWRQPLSSNTYVAFAVFQASSGCAQSPSGDMNTPLRARMRRGTAWGAIFLFARAFCSARPFSTRVALTGPDCAANVLARLPGVRARPLTACTACGALTGLWRALHHGAERPWKRPRVASAVQ